MPIRRGDNVFILDRVEYASLVYISGYTASPLKTDDPALAHEDMPVIASVATRTTATNQSIVDRFNNATRAAF